LLPNFPKRTQDLDSGKEMIFVESIFSAAKKGVEPDVLSVGEIYYPAAKISPLARLADAAIGANLLAALASAWDRLANSKGVMPNASLNCRQKCEHCLKERDAATCLTDNPVTNKAFASTSRFWFSQACGVWP